MEFSLKKFLILFLSIFLLVASSCKSNIDEINNTPADPTSPESPADPTSPDEPEDEDSEEPTPPEQPPAPEPVVNTYYDVIASNDGLLIQAKSIPENLVKRTLNVFNITTGERNVNLFFENKQEIVYPFVKAGSEYIISLSLNDANWSSYTDAGSYRITATGGLGDFCIHGDGVSYDGNNSISITNFSVQKPSDEFEFNPYYAGGNIYTTASNATWQYGTYKSYSGNKAFSIYTNTFDISTGTATIPSEIITNDLTKDYPNFWVQFTYEFQYDNKTFTYQLQPYLLFAYSKPAEIYSVADRLQIKNSSEGFYLQKYGDNKYPNVRVKVYNETKKHVCPTVILNESYKEFSYDYLNIGDTYTFELYRWDANWTTYEYFKIKNITARSGKGDFYFETNGYSYDQGTNPNEYVADIKFDNATFTGRQLPSGMEVNGTLYIDNEGQTYSKWAKFPYTYTPNEKIFNIHINSEIKNLRGKTFYADMGVKWTYNSLDFELPLIFNKDNRFTDSHVKGVNNITNAYTVLPEYGTFNIASELQGKTAYLIKYNKSDVIRKDKSPARSAYSNVPESRSAAPQQPENPTGRIDKTFEPIDPGKRLGPVTSSSRNARAINPQNYTIGQKKNFTVFTSFNEPGTVTVNAALKTEGNHCYVWYANNNPLADSKLQKSLRENKTSFQTLAEKFDAMYDLETCLIGPKKMLYNYDQIITTSETDKVNILVFDIYADHTDNQQGGTYGYFAGNDYYKKNINEFSNECEMIYVDSAFFATNPEGIYSTLTHEFQHLLHFVNKNLNMSLSSESWFTEMMSLGTELALQNKRNASEENSVGRSRAPLFNSGYNFGFELWGTKDLTYDYSNATIFINFLMTNFGGINLLQEIAHNEYVNEAAITQALQKLGYQETFDTVMMKMGQMIVNSYDSTVSSSDLTINRDITSEIIDNYGVKQSLTLTRLDLKTVDCYTPEKYSYDNRVRFSNCNEKNGPTIMKPNANFAEIFPKAIAVYQLTTKCGSTLEIKNPGQDIEMAIYFK